MNKLPILISVPHAGLTVPPEVDGRCSLTEEEIAADGDGGAAEIYDISNQVEAFVTTDTARAIVDLNRPEDDRRKDGVIKTHTCWDVPIYNEHPSEELIETLLEKYHRPYHARLRDLAGGGLVFGLDCHTMAEHAPPVAPDPGSRRPAVCLSNAHGTCPDEWIEKMAELFAGVFSGKGVSINTPFRGGHITRSHSVEMPWMQLELSRGGSISTKQKKIRVLEVLERWCRYYLP